MRVQLYYKFIHILLIPLILGCSKQEDEKTEVKKEPPLFSRISSDESGITFKNDINVKYENYFEFFAYIYNGAGVAIGDINNDELPDIYFTGNEVSNKLYLNQGELKFKDITSSAGVDGGDGWHNGVTMVDINHDGFLDIYVCRGGWQDTDAQRKNLLYINQGDLTFKEEAQKYGLDEVGYSNHAAFFDMDNDNDLDAFIINRPDSFFLPLSKMASRKLTPHELNRDKLYINENGKYREIGWESGIDHNYGYALGLVTADLNQDGYIDIMVTNDYADNDYLYINQKDGTFKQSIKQATNHISLASMGVDVADIDNDGLEDMMVTEMMPVEYKRSKISMPPTDQQSFDALIDAGMYKQYMHNMLYLNQGDLFFSEIARLAGVFKTDWSWSCLLSDLDNDGYRDVFVSNGVRRDLFDGDSQQRLLNLVKGNRERFQKPEDLFQGAFDEFINVYKPVKLPNYLFKNTGNLTFEDVSQQWGFNDSSFSNGGAIGDLDNDGDLDIVINNLEHEAFLYENTSNAQNNYLKIDLQGPEKNPNGLGAKTTLYYDGQTQYFEHKIVRGYLSSNEPVLHFGLGDHEKIDSLKVVWTDGKSNHLTNIEANQTLKVNYENAVNGSLQTGPDKRNKLFRETSTALFSHPYVHKENKYNDYNDQPLLPHMISRSGPFIARGDVNNDGQEDVFVGGAAGQSAKLYVQRNGRLIPQAISAFENDKAFEDMGAAFFDADQDGDADLYVVSGGYEFEGGSEKYQDRLYLNNGKGYFSKGELPKITSSGSCVVPHDLEGDGDIDLFVGGHVVPKAYPFPPKSYLLINDNGKFVDKTSEIATELSDVGMVNSATWTDLNGDKVTELIVVGEWIPIKVFTYKNGQLTDVSANYGLENTEGWWNKVVAEDLDDDGDQDLILGNHGQNTEYTAHPDDPLEVFARDFDRDGVVDVILGWHHGGELVPVKGIESLSRELPYLSRKFPSYRSFANANLREIVGVDLYEALNYKAHIFSSIILINDNGKLNMKKLPVEAQFSTVNGIVAKDLDNDGIKDLLLTGNNFDVEIQTTPADASLGLFLKGTGNLNFQPQKPYESGFFVPYNVKDMQAIKVSDEWKILVSVNDDMLRGFSCKIIRNGRQ